MQTRASIVVELLHFCDNQVTFREKSADVELVYRRPFAEYAAGEVDG